MMGVSLLLKWGRKTWTTERMSQTAAIGRVAWLERYQIQRQKMGRRHSWHTQLKKRPFALKMFVGWWYRHGFASRNTHWTQHVCMMVGVGNESIKRKERTTPSHQIEKKNTNESKVSRFTEFRVRADTRTIWTQTEHFQKVFPRLVVLTPAVPACVKEHQYFCVRFWHHHHVRTIFRSCPKQKRYLWHWHKNLSRIRLQRNASVQPGFPLQIHNGTWAPPLLLFQLLSQLSHYVPKMLLYRLIEFLIHKMGRYWRRWLNIQRTCLVETIGTSPRM